MDSNKKATPAPSKPAILGRNGFVYRPRFGVIVICRDETHQASIWRRLKADGHKCRVVSV